MAPPLKSKPPEGLTPDERKTWLASERSRRARAAKKAKGGGPIGAVVSKECDDTLTQIAQRYGLTKLAALEALLTHADARERIRKADAKRAAQ